MPNCSCNKCGESSKRCIKTCLLTTKRLEVTEGPSNFNGTTNFHGPVNVTGPLNVIGNETISGNLTVGGTTTFNGGSINNGNETFNGSNTFNGPVVFNNATTNNAPPVITVNRTAVPNGYTIFNTIQAAITSLDSKRIVDTQINVAPDTYPESINISSILSSDASKLNIRGDMRDIVGCGINHGSFWNVGGAGPVGGIAATGEAVLAGTSGVNTLSVTGALGATPPDFVAALVVAGDRVLIRHNDGTFAIYTIAVGGVTATVLTFTTVLAANVNALGAAMCVIPRVEIAAPLGSATAIIQGTQVKLSGLFINSPAGTIGLRPYPLSNTVFDNVLMFGTSNLITTPLVGSGSGHPTLSTQGGRTFGSTFFFNGTGTAILLQVFGYFALQNSLVAGRPGAIVLLSAMSLISTGNTRYLCNVTLSSRSYFATATGSLDIITHTGTALYLEYGALATANTGRWRILGTPTAGPSIGIDVHDSRVVLKLAPVTFSSIDGAFIPMRLGSTLVSGENADVSINLGAITMTSPGPIAQVLNGSRLSLDGIIGPIILGAGTNGFVVDANASMIWNAGSFAPVGNSTGVMFNVTNNSRLTIAAGAGRTFSGYDRFFIVDGNSDITVNNTTTTSPTATQFHYALSRFSHAVLTTVVQTNGLTVGNNITLGSGMVRTGSGTVYASADFSSQNL